MERKVARYSLPPVNCLLVLLPTYIWIILFLKIYTGIFSLNPQTTMWVVYHPSLQWINWGSSLRLRCIKSYSHLHAWAEARISSSPSWNLIGLLSQNWRCVPYKRKHDNQMQSCTILDWLLYCRGQNAVKDFIGLVEKRKHVVVISINTKLLSQ